jgi:H+/Cl- antiporter ClcA
MAAAPAGGFARERFFWQAVAWAAVMGLVMGVVGLAFLGTVQEAPKLFWGRTQKPDFLGGEPWWIALGAGFGLAVGVLRRLLSLPPGQANIFDEIAEANVDYRSTPATVVVSAVSLVGGVSLGPEAAMGAAGGAVGGWSSDRRGADPALRRTNVLSGIAGAFGGLFTAPLLGPLLLVEVARAEPRRAAALLISMVVASTLAFAIFFPIVGHTFMAIYELPAFHLEVWHLFAAVGIGALGAVLAVMTGVSMRAARAGAGRLAKRPVALCTLGGAVVGLFAYLLPLTLFSGSDQLETVIAERAPMGVALLVAIVAAKMLTFAVSASTGFIGGVIFPMIFIGGTAGVALHEAIPELPLALTVSCAMAAVPGAVAAIPFSLIAIVGFSATIGPSEVAPVGIAVLTAYLLVAGMGLAEKRRDEPGPGDGRPATAVEPAADATTRVAP